MFDRDLPFPKQGSKTAREVEHVTETSLTTTEMNANPKFSKDDLKKLKDRFNQDKRASNTHKFVQIRKKKLLEDLKCELEVVKTKSIDKDGIRQSKQLNKKLDFVDEKYGEAMVFQETLKYMLNRDLKGILYIKDTIGNLKAKRQRINQSIKEVQQEIDKNKQLANLHNKDKLEIESQFKNYIQSIE